MGNENILVPLMVIVAAIIVVWIVKKIIETGINLKVRSQRANGMTKRAGLVSDRNPGGKLEADSVTIVPFS